MLNGESTENIETFLDGANWIVISLKSVSDGQVELLRRFFAERSNLIRNKNVILFSFTEPYYLDATDISKLTAYYGLYSKQPAFVEVAARLLFQQIPAPGASPVSIPAVGYDLITATRPDPDQVIPLSLDEGEIPRTPTAAVRLQKIGAGAFCAVAQGSGHEDAAIVRLSYRPRGAKRRLALVGKGICFDTGGDNLKPARYMTGMHGDMNGSAVAVALLQAAAALRVTVAVDCWLAIAENHLSPGAYLQGDIVRALDGTTIEVVHTDAEGRMVLADTLALAAKAKPELIIDFATLTGSMETALGTRYSGIFATTEGLVDQAVAAGKASGERVCAFPLDEDYEAALDSKVADIKQCTMEGSADHILAARFLKRFVGKTPSLHMNLSASNCEGGLGAAATGLTGFGVGWGAHFLPRWL